MRYLLLIYTVEPSTSGPSEEMLAEFPEYGRFTQWARDNGMYQAGEALHPTSAATTVQVRDGRTITTDGPYAETKEALGGFYLIEARDLDEAIDAAARIPGARHGSIEVRPIFEQRPSERATSAANDEAIAPAG